MKFEFKGGWERVPVGVDLYRDFKENYIWNGMYMSETFATILRHW